MYHAYKASYAPFNGPKKYAKLSRSGVFLRYVKLAMSRDLKGAKMMLQTNKISCKQSENVVKIF